MVNAAPFEPKMFASILKQEVEKIAQEHYGGTGERQLRKAFAHWCIKNISSFDDMVPEEVDKECKDVVRTYETEDQDDSPIDGAWFSGNTLYLMQSAYEPPVIDEDEEFETELYAKSHL